MKTALLVAFSAFTLVASQRLSFGRCPQAEPARSLAVDKLLGKWWEIERSFYLVETPLSCTVVNFTLDTNQTLHIDVSYKAPWRNNQSTVKYVGEYKETPGVITLTMVDLPSFLSRLAPGSGKYLVMDTDYTEFALIYSCTNFRFLHADFVWILGRSKDISANTRTHIYSALDKIGVSRDRLLLTKHEC